MPLSDVLYQDAAQLRVQRALRSMRTPHAYLFTGPAGVGKEMLATRLAQVLLCPNALGHGTHLDASARQPVASPVAALSNREAEEERKFDADATPSLFGGDADDSTPSLFGNSGDPAPAGLVADLDRMPEIARDASSHDSAVIDACGTCTDCVLFAAGNHPDFHRIHRMLAKLHPDKDVRNRKATVISIDVIRHFLLQPIGVRPGRGRAKVFVIVEAERLSDDAQNAMLKTLEEPPPHSYLILLAASADSMLATTRSRCQQVSFGTLPGEFIVERLKTDQNLLVTAAHFLSELSQGSLGLALKYADLGLHENIEGVAAAISRALSDPFGASKALQDFAKELAVPLKQNQDDDEADTNASRDAQGLVLAMISTILRDAQRRVVGAQALALGDHELVGRLAAAADTQSLRAAIRAMSMAEYQVGRNVNTGLIIDNAAIALSRIVPV